MEIFPERLDHMRDLTLNRNRLTDAFLVMFDAIVASFNAIPHPIRVLSHYLWVEANEKYPQSAETCVGSFFFLRFVCPGIMIPQNYRIITDKPNPVSQRTLILIAKILQALANNLPFQQKEEAMMYFNPLLESKKAEYTQFLEALIQLPDGKSETVNFTSKVKEETLQAMEKALEVIILTGKK